MRRMLRDVKELIARRGGRAIEIEQGGKHTFVYFNNPAGVRTFVAIHKGSNPHRYEEALRSELRRKGLKEDMR